MLTEYQITKLRKVQDIILSTPKQFIMRNWTGRSYYAFTEDVLYCGFTALVRKKPRIPNCGTAACIRGWLECLNAQLKPNELRIWPKRDVIGLDNKQAKKLYFFSNWPKKFQRAKIEGTPAFARQAARRIDHFIATNGEE